MNELLTTPVIWFLVGLVLLILELVLPGLIIIFFPSPVPQVLGPYMVFLPPYSCIIFLTTFNMFSEWLLMFTLMGWIIPVALIMLKYINRDIASKK